MHQKHSPSISKYATLYQHSIRGDNTPKSLRGKPKEQEEVKEYNAKNVVEQALKNAKK